MSEEGKERLDRLQARLLAEAGKKFTQQELLDRLVSLGMSQFALLADQPRKMTAAQKKRFLALPQRTGLAIRPEDYDDILYGRRP